MLALLNDKGAIMSKLRAIRDTVIVKVRDRLEKSEGGIILPDTVEDKPMLGIVVDVGPGSWSDGVRQPMELKEGNEIVFGPWSGHDIDFEGEKYRVLEEGEVIGIVNK